MAGSSSGRMFRQEERANQLVERAIRDEIESVLKREK